MLGAKRCLAAHEIEDGMTIVRVAVEIPRVDQAGHSNAAIGSAVFVTLWLNAKLKVFADARGIYWKMFALL